MLPSLHVSPVVLPISKLPIQQMLIYSLWHCADSWQEEIQFDQYGQGDSTDWILWNKNPPGASHMGGVWERQIQTARGILEGLLKTHVQSLNNEALRTLVA